MSNLFPSMGKNDNLDKVITTPLFHTIEYEIADIANKMKNIDNLNEKEIKDIIIRQHSMILNYDNFLSSRESRSVTLELFTNEKFLRYFLDVIRILDISSHEKICINKIAYDYYSLQDKNQRISDLLYQLTTEVNGKEVLILSSILGRTDAQILSMIRNSSFKEDKVVHRVNTFLVKYNKIELSLSQIVSIYCYLFPRVTTLFVQTMLENKPSVLTESECNNFDKISIAMLEIINSMPSAEIKKVMGSYSWVLNNIHSNITVRFALKTAYRYDRIIKVAKEVDSENIGIYNIKIP